MRRQTSRLAFLFLYYPTPTKGWLAGFGLQSDSHRLPPMTWEVGEREFKIQIHLHRCMQVTNNLISIKFCGSAISEIFFIQLYWTCLTVGADLFFSSNRWSWFLFYSPLALVEKRCFLSSEDFFQITRHKKFLHNPGVMNIMSVGTQDFVWSNISALLLTPFLLPAIFGMGQSAS